MKRTVPQYRTFPKRESNLPHPPKIEEQAELELGLRKLTPAEITDHGVAHRPF
jgi:hypothetical protein